MQVETSQLKPNSRYQVEETMNFRHHNQLKILESGNCLHLRYEVILPIFKENYSMKTAPTEAFIVMSSLTEDKVAEI